MTRLLIRAGAIVTIAICFALSTSAQTKPMPEWLSNLPDRRDMPDPLVMNDGTRVATPEQWKQRRQEMKNILIEYELGHSPPPPGNVKGTDVKSQAVLDGKANYRLVHLSFGPEEKLGID